MSQPITRFRLTDHARLEITRRNINQEEISLTLSKPDQVLSAKGGLKIYQLRVVSAESSKSYLL